MAAHDSVRYDSRRSTLTLTVDEAAFELRLGRSKLYELMRTGALPFVVVGKRRRFRRQDLEAFLARGGP